LQFRSPRFEEFPGVSPLGAMFIGARYEAFAIVSMGSDTGNSVSALIGSRSLR
jgi:hypothetical protein